MTEEQAFIVGEILPQISSVSIHQGFHVVVTWESGSRAGKSDVVDLGPTIMTRKLYAPLRDDSDLFRTVRIINYGSALGWGNGEDIDMSAEGVEDLAEQTMTAADFRLFMDRHKLTQEAAAAQLGISRRQVNYFLTSKSVPRTVALACSYLDGLLGEEMASSNGESIIRSSDNLPPGCQLYFYDARIGNKSDDRAVPSVMGNYSDKDIHVYYGRKNWSSQAVSVVSVKDVASGKADLASLAANNPVIVKP